jgi:branched-chain amino acid transport system permease protein
MSVLARPRARDAVLGIAFLLLFLSPAVVSVGMLRTLLLAVVLGLVASGINFVMGYGGQLALGHVFFYGAAAYATAILATRAVTTNAVLLVFVGIAVAIVCALITGIPGLRLSNWTLGLVSFFLIQIIPDVVNIDKGLTGGPTGIIAIPQLELGGPLDTTDVFRFAVVLLLLWLVVQRGLVFSAYGRMLAVLRHDEAQLASLGVSGYRFKLMVYVLSAVPAGMAGTAFAAVDGFISPASFTLTTAILSLAAVVIGGQRTMYGPLIGTYILVEAQQRMLSFEEYTLLIFGGFLVVAAVLLPGGIVGTVSRYCGPWVRRTYLAPKPSVHADPVPLGPEHSHTLAVSDASKRFGGVQALADVSMTAEPGHITALIGPNGSGKTTLLNAISGFYRLDSGTVRLDDVALERLRPERVAINGVGRTFQTPSIPPDLTVREAVAVATFSGRRTRLLGAVLRGPRWRREEQRIARRTDEVLRELDLADDADTLAAALPLGRKRLVEIARAIMLRPSLLILDEAASGLDPSECSRLAGLLRRLADEGTAVLLVEHNMELVLEAADRAYVLAQGRLIAAGKPADVVRDPAVVSVYLGDTLEYSGAVA